MSYRPDNSNRPSASAGNERSRHPAEHRRRDDQKPRPYAPPGSRPPRDGGPHGGSRDAPRHSYRSSSGPPRSNSDADQLPEPAPRRLSDAGPGLQTGTPPKSGLSRGGLSSSNALLAEAARHLREQEARKADAARRAEQLRAAEDGLNRSPGAKRAGGNRWTEDDDDEDDGREDGELASDPQAPSAKRQRHSPIVWGAKGGKQPAKPGDSGAAAGAGSQREPHMDKVESTTRLAGLDISGAESPASPAPGPQQGPLRPRSAAELIAAEAEEFQRRVALGEDDIDPAAPPAMRASPSDSDDGGVVEDMDAEGVAPNEPGTAPSVQEKRGHSRWLEDQEEDREAESVSAMEAAEARLNAAEREAAEAASQDMRLRPAIGAVDVFEEEEEEEVPPKDVGRVLSMLQECRKVDLYKRINRISEGSYGWVYQAHVVGHPDKVVALKKVKLEKEKDGFPLTALREVNILLSFHHANIVDVKEVVVGNSLDSVYMVMEYMEHDLKALMDSMKQPFSVAEVKCLMYQLFDGIEYLHDNWVLHRDLKTSNILYNNKGEVKICDLGMARQYGSPLKPYTGLVTTLHYRAPELLLSEPRLASYSTAVDMWSLGCIMGELLKKRTLFAGKNEIEQLNKIFGMLGAPNDTVWPGWSKLPCVNLIAPGIAAMNKVNKLRQEFPAHTAYGQGLTETGYDLLSRLLTLDPSRRINAKEALCHDWFRESPHPKDKILMPTFPERHRNKGRNTNAVSPGDPRVAKAAQQQLADLGGGGLFSLK